MNRITVAVCASVVMFASSAFAQQEDVCKPQVEAKLKEAGIEWSQLKNVQWDVDTWNSNKPDPEISGYQFFAQPESCSEGSILIEMDDDCRISDARARGGCTVAGWN